MRLIQALKKENRGPIPIWLMRQAGRFLPEYQELKRQFSMHDLFYEKKLIKKITKMPIERFPLDAAIIFSDILLPLEAIGGSVELEHFRSPVVKPPSFLDFDRKFDLKNRFSFLYESIQELTEELDVPLIGFSGGPLTLFTYLFPDQKEGGEFYFLKKWIYEDPIQFQKILDWITDLVSEHLQNQIDAGCQVVQIFDSWAGRFSYEHFFQYSIKPIQKIILSLKKKQPVPIIFFSRNLGAHYDRLSKIEADAISIDGSVDLKKVWNLPQAIQGHFDPALLLTSPQVIRNQVLSDYSQMDYRRWIANLGHGVLPQTPIENVLAFIESIRLLNQ